MKKLLCFFIIAPLILSCSQGKKKEDSDRTPIITVEKGYYAAQNIEKRFTFISRPYHTTTLSFRVSGPVKYIDAYPGNYFKKGDIIATIDDRDYIIRKEQAESVYHQAKSEYGRIKNLYEKNNISASTFDKAVSDYISAKTTYEIIQNELYDTKLLAPFDGYISNVYVEQHQEVKATQPIVTFVDNSQMKIETYVSQDIAMKYDDIKEIKLTFDAFPGKYYYACVADISKSTSENNLSYLLTALLPNKDLKLLSGMSGEIIFGQDQADSVVVVPQIAVSHSPLEGDYLWCVDPITEKVSKRMVELGSLLPDGNIVVTKNLQSGEVVATSGLRFLSSGLKVKIK
jgi:RND family efflux transporter MFP subunit